MNSRQFYIPEEVQDYPISPFGHTARLRQERVERKSRPRAVSGSGHFPPGQRSCAPYNPESFTGVSGCGDILALINSSGSCTAQCRSADEAVAGFIEFAVVPVPARGRICELRPRAHWAVPIGVAGDVCFIEAFALALAGRFHLAQP
jgi:hypothetical protein